MPRSPARPARLGAALLAAGACAGLTAGVGLARGDGQGWGPAVTPLAAPASEGEAQTLARHRAALLARTAPPALAVRPIAATTAPAGPAQTTPPPTPAAALAAAAPVPLGAPAILPAAGETAPPAPAPLVAASAAPRTEVVEPAPEPVTRLRLDGAAPPERPARVDPLHPPLLEKDRWDELVLAATQNGVPLSDGALFVRSPDGKRLAVALAEARRWRLKIDEGRILTLNGEPWYPIDLIPGATWSVDDAALTAALQIPSDAFERTVLSAEAAERGPAVAGRGGYLDYDMVYQTGDRVEARLDGLLELGAFAEPGAVASSFLLTDLFGETRDIVRLETQLVHDMPDKRESLRLGDGVTVPGAFAAPIRFGGFQLATSFETDPSFITFPLPTIGGLAENQSVVEVFEENLQRIRRDVPAGPFEIDQLPVLTGAGELQVKVTDLLGRERLVTQSYYVSTRLLRAGLRDFSYELGFPREAYGEESFAYDEPFLATTQRYGFSDTVTLEGRLEASMTRQTAIAGGSLLIPGLGVVSLGLGGSLDEDADAGFLAQLDYEYVGRPFSVGLRTRYASEGFRQLGDLDPQPARIDQASLGLDLGAFGYLGLLALHRDERGAEDELSLSTAYSLTLGPGSLVVSAAKFLEPDDGNAFLVAYSIPLGVTRSVDATVQVDDGKVRGRLQARQGKADSDLGMTWRIATEIGDDGRPVDASIGYDAALASGRLDAVHEDGDSDLRANLAGSVALVDGTARLSRRLGRAFGMVALPGFADVPVYLDNRLAGTTDSTGHLLLPSLRPYESNQIRIDIDKLPLDATVRETETRAVPAARSGMTVRFDIAREHPATARLLDAGGLPLPAGTALAERDGPGRALVGRDGFAQIEGLREAAVTLEGEIDGRPVACALPVVAAGVAQPDLGELRCR